jgi:hypothetical protein
VTPEQVFELTCPISLSLLPHLLNEVYHTRKKWEFNGGEIEHNTESACDIFQPYLKQYLHDIHFYVNYYLSVYLH